MFACMQINLQLTCLPKSQQPPSQMILMAQKHFGRALLLFRKNLTMLLNLIQQQTPQRSSNLDPINNRSLTSKEKVGNHGIQVKHEVKMGNVCMCF